MSAPDGRRRSMIAGQAAVPIRRNNLSGAMAFNADMRAPFPVQGRDRSACRLMGQSLDPIAGI
jgi:hypothetical protein